MANPNPSPETRWEKGKSGNPSGRPKLFTTILREMGQEADAEKCRQLAETCWKKAIGGDYNFASLVVERLDGKLNSSEPDRDATKLPDLVAEAERRAKEFKRDEKPIPKDS
jgi:hypothetical protein